MGDESRTEFGPLLRQAREKRGVSLQQVAATTKISARVLDALERNDPSKLPGGIFSRAFVRAYAREVGLDPEETVSRFVAAFPPDSDEAAPPVPSGGVDAEGFESRRRTAMTLFQILGLSVLVVVIAAVYMNVRPTPVVPPDTPAMSGSSAQPASSVPAESPAAPAAADPAAVATPTGDPAAIRQAPAGQSDAGRPPAGPPVVPETAPAQPMATPASSAPGAPLNVSISADAECWLSLSVDGTRVVARNLQPGERVQYGAQKVIIVSAGNAGALAMTINGRPARPLGGRGEVVTATITADGLSRFFE